MSLTPQTEFPIAKYFYHNNEFRLLYSKPTHSLLLNTLSHPHFKTLQLLKNVLKCGCESVFKRSA
jgi:hypothetical protein